MQDPGSDDDDIRYSGPEWTCKVSTPKPKSITDSKMNIVKVEIKINIP